MSSAKTDVREAAQRHCRGICNPGSDLRHQTACNTLAGNITRIPALRPVVDEVGETSIKRVHRSALTETEIALLDQLVKDKSPLAPQRKTRSHYLTKIAKLAGYLAHAKKHCHVVRPLRLTDIGLGFISERKL